MTDMLSDHYYRVMLAITMAAVVACVFTIFTATAPSADARTKTADVWTLSDPSID